MTTTTAPATTVEDMKALLRTIPLEILSGGRLEDVLELISDDFVEHSELPPGVPPTAVGLVEVWRAVRAGFPDVRFELLSELAQGDLIAHRIRATGTHLGTFMGIAPTGRQVSWEELHLVRHAGGRFTEHWGVVAMMPVLAALQAPAHDLGALAREAIEAVYGRGDLDAAERYWSPRYVDHPPILEPGQPTTGPAAVKFTAGRIRAAFPDLTVTVDDVVVEGDEAFVRLTWSGTQHGPIGPFPASGRRATWTGLGLARFEDGKIVDAATLSDMAQLARQITA